MTQDNLNRLKKVADGLGLLKDQVVFVGGSVAELYVDDPAATDVRMTEDVDCVIPLSNYRSFYELEEKIRMLGFKNDTTPGAPICRWIFDNETVDIMPDDKGILGFTNRWYKSASGHRVKVHLNGGTSIYIFPTMYYIATKIEAILGRGGDDLRGSHDLEDIIYVINNCKHIRKIFDSEQNDELKSYITNWARDMLCRANFREEIECSLDYEEIPRVPFITEIISHFATSAGS